MGKCKIHFAESSDRAYIMKRKRGGGTKRVYLGTKTAKKTIKTHDKLIKRAKREK